MIENRHVLFQLISETVYTHSFDNNEIMFVKVVLKVVIFLTFSMVKIYVLIFGG